MSALTLPEELSDLPSLVDHAAKTLANARSSAEVLQAKEMAGLAYDQAKRAGRLARAQKAHNDLLSAALQVQGDAAEIEHGAVARLAEEYAAAQERGEVAGRGGERSGREHSPSAPSAADIGISRKDVHQGRMVRDAEKAQPGIIHRTVRDLVERGEEPTKAAIGRAVSEAAGRPAPPPRAPASPPAGASKLLATPAAASDDAAKAAVALNQFIVATNELAKVEFADLKKGDFPNKLRSDLQTRCKSYAALLDGFDEALEGRTHA